MYHSIKRGVIASLTGVGMVMTTFVGLPAQAANTFTIDCTITPGPEWQTLESGNFYGYQDIYLGGTQAENITVTIQNCNYHLVNDNNGYLYNDYVGAATPATYELTIPVGGLGDLRGYNTFGSPSNTTFIYNIWNSADPNYVEPAFTVTDSDTSEPLQNLTGESGTPLNKSYNISLVGDGWAFGEPGKGWSYSFSWRPNSGVEYDLILNGAFGEAQSFTMNVTGTPTQGYYRDQSLMIRDDNGQTFTYQFKLAIEGEGVTNIVADPSNFTYGDPSLPSGKDELFLGSSFPSLYAVNPANSSRVAIVPPADHNLYKVVTENNGVTTYNFPTGELFVDETYGSIHADVTVTLSNGSYAYTVDTYSYDWEGYPVEVDIQLDAPLAAGDNYTSGTTSASGGKAVLPNSTNQPFVVFTTGDATPTVTEENGTLTIGHVMASTSLFTIEFFDYTGCPTVGEMVAAYDAGSLTTTGFVSETECAIPSVIDLDGQTLRFDYGVEFMGGNEPVLRDQRGDSDEDFAREALTGDYIEYYDVVTVDGVTLNAILTVSNLTGLFFDEWGDGILDEVDDYTGSNPQNNPWIRTYLGTDPGHFDKFAEYRIVFYVDGDANKTPVSVTNAILNAYDIDGYQYVEAEGVSSYVFAQDTNLAATVDEDGTFRFADIFGLDSDSGDESRVYITFGELSELVVRMGVSASETEDSYAFFGLDFSPGTDWTEPTQEPTQEPQVPTPPSTPTFSSDPMNNWYALDWSETPTLFQVDKVTGELTVIGTADEAIVYAGFTALEVDSARGIGYTMTYGSDRDVELYGINLSTGEFTLLHTFEGMWDATAMNLTTDGKMWFAADGYVINQIDEPGSVYGYFDLDTYEVTVLGVDANGERISALVSDENDVLYATGYNDDLFSYNMDENTWTLVAELSANVYAADYENGYLLIQGWNGDVYAIDIQTFEQVTLWSEYTMPAGMSWNGGEAFAVATNTAPESTPEPEPQPEPTPEPAPQPAPAPTMQVEPITPPTIGGKTGFETGEKVAVSGKTLDGLTKVIVGGVEVEFTNNTSTGLVITLPELADGVYDLVLIGAYGQLTYQDAIKIVTRVASIQEEAVKPLKATKLFSGFAPDSAVLTKKMKREIASWLRKHPNISLINITGMTQGPTVLKGDPKLAQRRAIVVKAYIKSIMPNVKFAKTRIKNQTITNAKYRGAVITVTYTK